MLRNPWPGGSDELGDIAVAEGFLQKRAARICDAEVGGKFEHGEGKPFMKVDG
jgi:hypothetical protein